ncbi:heat-inducible transcriptional repressor HrcA [Leeia sp. TBRC 13508]|uniref:Heat-inducible transcription repressor HrcA n=1 Tax=Leeia speluncae TaxID=2884804 RepID=A0ABS8D8J4_9NEIS|nr:heat-inducible transcriptional repressor HrcA [Leeia speluncae]MCB6184515.1 heat-inducible transcriptional repressor HrcA [Leeia speluncae]
MINPRAQQLLRVLVERYIEDGQPVGSRTLSQASGMDLSPASIRNVMSELENLGFVASPHTSAGRIPTPRGYRYFVDTLLTKRPDINEELRQQVESQFNHDTPQRLASTASHLLSELTQFAGVVVTPKRTNLAIRHIEFLQMGPSKVLLILVATDGTVQNRFLQMERDYSAEELLEAANFLNKHYVGCSFLVMRERLHAELKQLQSDVTALMNAALEVGESVISEQQENLVLSGEHNLISSVDLSRNVDRLKQLFLVFEQKTALMQLLDNSQRAEGVQLFIGSESGMIPLEECSVVTSSYRVDGDIVGTLGVIGPTRMAYDRVIPIVDVTAKLLSNALSQ